MKSKKPEVNIIKNGRGYLIYVYDTIAQPSTFQDIAVTQTELEEIVKQSLPYLRVPKGTKRVELKKK